MFDVSLSAVGLWRRCHMAYYNRYVRRLAKREPASPITLGKMVHEALAGYFIALRDHPEGDPYRAMQVAVDTVLGLYQPQLTAYANACFATGDEVQAREYFGMADLFTDLMGRYYRTRGYTDWSTYRVLHVEEPLTTKLNRGLRSRGVIDLVTQNRQTEELQLWEHKSTRTLPPPAVRLQDLQTMLYVAQLADAYGYAIRSVIWNYVRTTPPVEPRILKDGTVSLDRRIDTTWEIYSVAILKSGYDPESPRFDELRSRLVGREETVFFPRYEQVIVADPRVLLGEYIQDAKTMKQEVSNWLHGYTVPTRTLDRGCTWCEFSALCQAAIIAGDDSDVVALRYTQKEPSRVEGPRL